MERDVAPGCSSGADLPNTEEAHKVPAGRSNDWLEPIGNNQGGYDASNARAFVDAEDNLKFFPPLYRQRYQTVRQILQDERWSRPMAKVVEFGCAELAMFSYFKQISHITNVVMVDIDSNILEYYNCRAAPLTCDYVFPRPTPLHVEVLCGSVADCDSRLLGANAVVCIELIEHLELDIVEKLEKTIFGFIEPDIAVFTTPNSDFNVLLTNMQGKFRHWDHKFEWTRTEFIEWTNKVISLYPHYRVEVSGVGEPPEGSDDVGHCSQLAVFIRGSEYTPVQEKDTQEVYTTCQVYDHPVKQPDPRSDEDKLNDEISYQLHKLGYYECYMQNEGFALIALQDLTTVIQRNIPTADSETIRHALPPIDVVEQDGDFYVKFYPNSPPYESSSCDDFEEGNALIADLPIYGNNSDNSDEEIWDIEPPLRFTEPAELTQYHMALATFDNATNLMQEMQAGILGNSDNEDDNSDNDLDPGEYDEKQQDCERRWNLPFPPKPFVTQSHHEGSSTGGGKNVQSGNSHSTDDFSHVAVCAAPNPVTPLDEQRNVILNSRQEPITDSGVDLSPLLNPSYPQDEGGDIFPYNNSSKLGGDMNYKSKDLPKSTSVEVLHLDGSCTLKRRAGLEYVEFAPSTSVTLCYTGQTYCDVEKVPSRVNMSMSSERKSLDGSLVRGVADSYSLDFAGDSGYPNSSSLHHDIDVDLTPEQVDDISSENDDRSNQSLSEDELSDSDRVPALPRRVIHPRRPVVPIVFENVENGDLANNNRDGEGNNAVAPLGDEREFIALVQEGEMQPLLAAPVVDDVILPNNADPFPGWLMALLIIEENDQMPGVKIADELECDEGLGEDSI